MQGFQVPYSKYTGKFLSCPLYAKNPGVRHFAADGSGGLQAAGVGGDLSAWGREGGKVIAVKDGAE